MVNSLMDQLGVQLNLKPHKCGSNKITLTLPTDIEIHLGHDNRIYCLGKQNSFYQLESKLANFPFVLFIV